MEVSRNLRVPKAGSGRPRMVRVVGDGTPPNTRILDMVGEPIPEMVNAYSIQGDTNGCARGVFVYYEVDENDQLVEDPETGDFLEGTFEAFVVMERPPTLTVDQTRKAELDRLAGFIIDHVPGEPSENEGAVDTAIRLLHTWVPVPVEDEYYWSCKIGPVGDELFKDELGQRDARLREMVQDTFRAMFGADADEVISGWSAHLTKGERWIKDYHQYVTPREGGSTGAREGGTKEFREGGDSGTAAEPLEVGGIGTPTGPALEKASDAPAECFAEPRESTETLRAGTPREGGTKEFRGGSKEGLEDGVDKASDASAECFVEPHGGVAGESNEATFSRLAPGGDGCGESR